MSIKGLNPRFWHLNHHIKPRQTPCHVRCVLRDTIFSIPIQGTSIFSYLSWQIGFRGGYWFSLVERGHGYPISRIKCWHTFLEFLPPASAVEVIESVLCFRLSVRLSDELTDGRKDGDTGPILLPRPLTRGRKKATWPMRMTPYLKSETGLDRQSAYLLVLKTLHRNWPFKVYFKVINLT